MPKHSSRMYVSEAEPNPLYFKTNPCRNI